MIPLSTALFGAAAVAVAVAYFQGRSDGRAACERAATAAQVIAQAEALAQYEAAIAWGNQVSGQLAHARRHIQSTKESHETAALDLVGTCPVGLRVLHDAAASGDDLPQAARASLAAPGTVAADWVGSALAVNYARARDCQAQLTALIEWHEGQP